MSRPSGPQSPAGAHSSGTESKIISRLENARPGRSPEARKPRCRVGAGGLAMQSRVLPVPVSQHPFAELDRLGDEIAELSAHLDAATARLLALIREFDARGGWNTGFRSCAAWLSWRSEEHTSELQSRENLVCRL